MRRIRGNPNSLYFKTAGVRMLDLDEVILTRAEFEALRLRDVEDFEQKLCAEKMDISQPTFHRLLLAARKKVADGIVLGKAIRIDGGKTGDE
ncbi:DUF134 domain-containing protein [Candidatus Woesearchaeota archaeon]|nr:DUF134 domain-containing protein [Candidatus Woesearchaeota archaeon]